MGGLLSCRPIFFVLCHLAICKVKYVFMQPHFYHIFSWLLWVSSCGGHIAFSLWQKDFKHIFLLIKFDHISPRKLSAVKMRKLACYGFYTKMRGRNNTTSHYGYSIYDYNLTKHFLISSFILSF